MLFRIVEHYEDDEPFKKELLPQTDINDCFICFELYGQGAELPIKLKNNGLYNMTCICDGSVHKHCLFLWYNANNECPICRKLMLKNDMKTYIILINNRYFVKIGIFFRIFSIQLLRIILCFGCFIITLQCYICFVVIFYYLIQNKKYEQGLINTTEIIQNEIMFI